ncbi:transglutaminase domain-containing protein [Methanobrevibacter curvatus]|uniref:Putative outer membrane protein pmp20 n=1 Tax=Methanobrevibacter curvatus TaxID=49547 RepID=A0A165Z9J2_9EURY|nr:transglutaminase domain-containing protein [Methanobrevibacter curvatus]KZX10436.1 putative outer membrane protein pmp20 precursor [Methanobrevibacter curvatus]
MDLINFNTRKFVHSGIGLRAGIFLLILVFLLSLSFSAASAGNIAVSGDSFGDINNIINTASSGDVIQLGSNTFKSNGSVIRITKENLTFTGASATNPATLSGENISRIAWVNANNITFKYIKFINGNGNTLGGTAITTYAKITVDNCTFLNNTGESGAAIFIYPQASNSIIKNSIFNNNQGIQASTDNFVQGGAIRSGTTNLTITDSTFTNNFALNDGGAISIANGTGTKIINCKFINNSANMGGAIRISDSEATISDSLFNQNNASNVGIIFILNGSATILNSNFTSNKANNGGAVGIYNRTINDNKIIILKNLVFDSNTATNMGGAIYTRIPIKYLNDSTFKNNSAIDGGGIYSLSNLQINAANFTQNTATTSGGAIYANGQISISSKSNFASNNANNGGSIYALKDLNIFNSIFSKNNAISNGGALYVNGGATKIVNNSNFSSNSGVNGGTIYSNGVLSIVSANFNDNLATGSGGAIYSINTLDISNSNFNNNSAKNGGAIYSTNQMGIISSSFTTNTATDGGAIYSTNNLSMSSSSFNKNTAKGNGGAILLYGSSLSTITGSSKFISNSAKNGGAIYTSSPLTISSTNLANNKVSANGGAIYSTSNLNISGGSVTGNTAIYGSGIYNVGTLSLNKMSLLSNKAKIFSVSLKAPSYVIKGDKLIVYSSLKSGDNLLNSIYTKNNNVNINGNRYALSSTASGKTISLKINNKMVTAKTNSSGIAVFKISTSGFSTPSNVKVVVSSSNNNGGVVNSTNKVKITKNSLQKELVELKKKTRPKSLTQQKISQLKKDLKTINKKIAKTKWKKDKGLKEIAKNINTILKNKKVDYYNTVKTSLKIVNKTATNKLVFSTDEEKSNLLSKVNGIKKNIKTYYSSKKITKKQKTKLNTIANSVYKVVNNKKVQAHDPVTEITWENGNKVETKWTNLIVDTNKKTTSKVYAKYMQSKSVNVTSWISYHRLVNDDPKTLQVYTQPFMTVESSKIILVNDTYKWVELSTSKLKEDYKWYYQENRTYKYYLATKTVNTYNKDGKLIKSTKSNGQSYLDIQARKLRDDWSMYILPSEFCDSKNSAIISLANAIKNNVTNKTDANLANAVLSWVHNNIEYELYGDTKYGAVETLSVKKGNCNDQAHLVVALLRALNIPAKYKANQREGLNGTEGHAWTYAYMILPKTITFNGNIVYIIVNNDEYIKDHIDYWWCGQTTDGDGKKLGYHWINYEWCTSEIVIGSYLDSFNCGSAKLEFIDGCWYALAQKVFINGQNVTIWSL